LSVLSELEDREGIGPVAARLTAVATGRTRWVLLSRSWNAEPGPGQKSVARFADRSDAASARVDGLGQLENGITVYEASLLHAKVKKMQADGASLSNGASLPLAELAGGHADVSKTLQQMARGNDRRSSPAFHAARERLNSSPKPIGQPQFPEEAPLRTPDEGA
jgi:hypothetical protein